LINGAWRTGRRGQALKDINPYTGETLVEIAIADQNDLDEAYQAAARAQPAWAVMLPGDIPGKECRVYRKPVGVVGVISPWNWPLHLSARSVTPALAVGNPVVLKPASDTPVTGGTLMAKLLEEAGSAPPISRIR
jgi:aldehyde dehydrogenase (NAD+)